MITAWVLILLITGPNRAAMISQDFTSKDACEATAKVWVDRFKMTGWGWDASHTCTPK